MESWLCDVKRVRIPRPKFESGRCMPREPPKDYILEDSHLDGSKRGGGGHSSGDYFTGKDLARATEELRRAVQEKL